MIRRPERALRVEGLAVARPVIFIGPAVGRLGHALFLREFTRPIGTARMISLITDIAK